MYDREVSLISPRTNLMQTGRKRFSWSRAGWLREVIIKKIDRRGDMDETFGHLKLRVEMETCTRD